MNADRWIGYLDLAADNFSERDAAQVIRVIQVGHQQFEPLARVGARRGDVLDDGVEKWLHRAAGMIKLFLGIAALGAGLDDREIKLPIRGMPKFKQFKNRVPQLRGSRVVAAEF